MSAEFRCSIAYAPERADYVMVLVRDRVPLGRQAFELTPVKASHHAPLPLLIDSFKEECRVEDLLRAIVDEAARVGIIPGDMGGVIGAKDKHLADMRALAFGALKIDPPRDAR